jgi:hypothetical protein
MSAEANASIQEGWIGSSLRPQAKDDWVLVKVDKLVRNRRRAAQG